jgi:hypothetical protein
MTSRQMLLSVGLVEMERQPNIKIATKNSFLIGAQIGTQVVLLEVGPTDIINSTKMDAMEELALLGKSQLATWDQVDR